jgi:hypothetical protein
MMPRWLPRTAAGGVSGRGQLFGAGDQQLAQFLHEIGCVAFHFERERHERVAFVHRDIRLVQGRAGVSDSSASSIHSAVTPALVTPFHASVAMVTLREIMRSGLISGDLGA